ncbi:pyridoxamine 5'-phosphate oxidase family protein [Nakamurella flava]|uniref:Pyridoxamine 5'-phosphate oxidase family protein n=1 Tax=Nakamurella flava TaxID=2576308 RepID=A0A4U6QEC2_9ACTN|nr:pyridoxamine 5'-phosphate oxidase family protein [Nakamurella flava]
MLIDVTAVPPASLVPLSPTARSTVRRGANRARTDRTDLYAVLDAGTVCHLGVVLEGAPVVLPTAYGRVEDTLYLHGSTGSASLRAAMTGSPVSVTVTLVDGVVHARSVFHFSMNYRSAVVHGTARTVTDPDERLAGLRALTEQVAPGAWSYARQPNRKELAATAVLALDLTEASVKVRTGPPVDDETDVRDRPEVWAGVRPLRVVADAPLPCPTVPDGVPVPAHLR